MNNELTCAYCKKKFTGPYITVIINAKEEHFCVENHVTEYFKKQDRAILEKIAEQQK